MATQIHWSAAQLTSTRKIPFLPRLGLIVDFGTRRFFIKHVPVLEPLANLLDGLSRAKAKGLPALLKTARQQLDEVPLAAAGAHAARPGKSPARGKPKPRRK